MVTIQKNTNLKASLKLLNNINSFLFEQEYDELKFFSPAQINKIKEAGKVLSKVINND